MRVKKQQGRQRGFALPAVLIASVVMLSVLSIAVTSVASIRTALKSQYYEQLAKTAGEAGVAYAKACLAKNSNVPLWTDAKPLQPHTDCAGNSILEPFVQVLVVGGGGGGGNNHGGGGGGGGVIYEGALNVATGNSFTISAGTGGSGATVAGAAGAVGNDSRFVGPGTSLVAKGGGGGGGRVSSSSSNQPSTKAGGIGSGGGGAGTISGSSPMAGRSADVTAGQGQAGGAGYSVSGSVNPGGGGGGGGGADAAGGNAEPIPYTAGLSMSGKGGNGYSSDMSGVVLRYGAGGSGGSGHSNAGSEFVAEGGTTGGGRGGFPNGVQGDAGMANTGAGGGGGAFSNGRGGAGGSGVVIVRYFRSGGVTANPGGTGVSVTESGAYRIFRYTSASSATFNVTAAGASSCPTDPRCSVLSTPEMRSSFSIKAPTLNERGQAVAIANTGYVELLRKSDSSVWRRYTQPSVQAAVVPDLCSGAATSGLGWSNAVPASVQDTIPNASSAMTVTLADTSLNAGQMYFRRDFPIIAQGSYTVSALTSNAQDVAEIYINGSLTTTSQGSLSSATVSLSPGCHTITARLTNKTVQPRPSKFTALVRSSDTNATPLVATDTAWRVSAGVPVSFASPDYYADASIWGSVRHYGLAKDINSVWTADQFAPMISPSGSGCHENCPPNATAYLRDSKNFQLSAPTEITVSAMCDDDCEVYINGDRVIDSSVWARQAQRTLTLPAGTYRMGVKLFNGGSAMNLSAVAAVAAERSTGMVYARTDNTWRGTNFWTPGNVGNIDGYEASFLPSPDDIPRPPTLDILLVGGGGGGGSNSGGGGGGGGVSYLPGTPVGVGDYTIGIGAGGYGATSTTVRGSNGGPSSMRGGPSWFADLSVPGGGGGASRDGGLAASNGGSGGGGAGATSAVRMPGALGTAGVGSHGGSGTTEQGAASKGGGGGGAGSNGSNATTDRSGNGGAGYISYFTGPRWVYAGGGIGGNTASHGTLGEATDRGGTIGDSMIHPSGGGGHGMGGNGAPGSVVIRFPIGSITVSASGAYSIRDDVIMGVNYRSYYFTEGGTFRILSIP